MAGRTKPARDECDVCVIGTGAGGGVMVQQLTAAGFDVVALQRGPFAQRSDFDDDELAALVRGAPCAQDAVESYRPDADTAAVAGRFAAVGHCVGGSTAIWSAFAWRFRPEELAALSREGPIEGASLADWPFDYEELEPYYQKAEWEFGVAGDAAAMSGAAPRKRPYPNPPHPPRAASLVCERAFRKLDYHPFPTPVAINPVRYGRRPACLHGGNCAGYGCPVDAKASTLSVSIGNALRTRRLDLRPNSVAYEIVLDKSGRARSVRYVDWKGRERELFARHVVLAGNAIGSSHLLLMSRSGSFPQGLANSSGLVGKNLMVHARASVVFVVDDPTVAWSGMTGHVAIDDLRASDPQRGFARGGVVFESNRFVAQPIVYALAASNGRPGLDRVWGRGFKDFLRTFPRAVALDAVLEDLPVEQNRIEIDPNLKDRHGLPLPQITHRLHPNDAAMIEWFRRRLLDVAEAAGARERWVCGADDVPTAGAPISVARFQHLLGTCRMGDDPHRSVVDRWCRSHDVKNLWIVDGSCFPTSGGCHPGLTILANAYRVADYFIEQAARRNL